MCIQAAYKKRYNTHTFTDTHIHRQTQSQTYTIKNIHNHRHTRERERERERETGTLTINKKRYPVQEHVYYVIKSANSPEGGSILMWDDVRDVTLPLHSRPKGDGLGG